MPNVTGIVLLAQPGMKEEVEKILAFLSRGQSSTLDILVKNSLGFDNDPRILDESKNLIPRPTISIRMISRAQARYVLEYFKVPPTVLDGDHDKYILPWQFCQFLIRLWW